MSKTITLRIPDETFDMAKSLAQNIGHPVEDVLSEWLVRSAKKVPVDMLPDDYVLELSEIMLPADEQEELDYLIQAQREDVIDDSGQRRLDELMEIYHRILARKAEALKVAIRRGLRPPISEDDLI